MDGAELSDAIMEELSQLFAETLKPNGARLVRADLDGVEQCLQEIDHPKGVDSPRRVPGRGVEVGA